MSSPAVDRPVLGAVVLHGLTGSPQSVEGLGAALAADGLTVRVPTLPGHGTRVEDLEPKRWGDWLAAAEAAYDEVVATCDRVLLAGLSMGGALACRIAADRPVAGLILVNPIIDPPAESFREILREIRRQGFTRAPGPLNDIADPDQREEGYPEMPVEPLLSLCEGLDHVLARLGEVTSPMLLMTSRTDHVVPPVSSDILAAAVAGPVERVWLEHSYHVATRDYDRAEVERRAVAFADKVRAG